MREASEQQLRAAFGALPSSNLMCLNEEKPATIKQI